MRIWLLLSTLSASFLLQGQDSGTSPAAALEAQIVSRLLASEEPVQLAWGARLAANYKLPQFLGDLLRLATASDFRVRAVAIDALLTLDIDVPESTLTQIAETSLDPAIILIARHPERYPELRSSLFRRGLEDRHWVAVHSVLLDKPPVGFAVSILQDWTIRLTVSVFDQGSSGGVGGSSFCGLLGVHRTEPSAFPAIDFYIVVENPRPGDVLLADGPHPVAIRKQRSPEFPQSRWNRDDYRRDYLMHLAGMRTLDPAAAPSLFIQRHSVQWRDEDSCRAEMAQALDGIRKSVAHLKDQLVERGVLSSGEAAELNPGLEVMIEDQRSVKEPPLPVVQWTLAVRQ